MGNRAGDQGRAKKTKKKPSLILVYTHLGHGSRNKQDTFEAHSSPLGEEEVPLTKQNLGWPLEPTFYIPLTVLADFRKALEKGKHSETKWEERFSPYALAYPDLAQELHQMMQGELSEGWDTDIRRVCPRRKGYGDTGSFGKSDE